MITKVLKKYIHLAKNLSRILCFTIETNYSVGRQSIEKHMVGKTVEEEVPLSEFTLSIC